MRAHYFQHVPFEGLGSIQSWLDSRDATVTSTRFFEVYAIPAIEDIDLLIAMGGPMSVNDEVELPWLVSEKAYIRDAIHRGVPVLGVCLGAQLIANALGARVYPNAEKEIGWFPITAVAHEGVDAFTFPVMQNVFHWHGETFDLPLGAVHLARSVACENQAFQHGERAIGLQFHIETTPESARAITEHCSDELVPSRFVQTAEQLVSAPDTQYREINALMDAVLAYITR